MQNKRAFALFVLVAGLGVLILTYCAGPAENREATDTDKSPQASALEDPSEDAVMLLDPDDFEKALVTCRQNGANPLLIDVRTKREWDQGHLEGAIHKDWYREDEFTGFMEQTDKSRDIYVYCAVGGRSHYAAQKLVSMGFKKVYNLDGGSEMWERYGKKWKW